MSSVYLFYVKIYDRQANSPPDGKRSPSPRGMCNTEGVTYALPIPKERGKELKEEGRVEGWDKKRCSTTPLTVRAEK